MDDKRYLVVLADRQRGKFFTIFDGNFEDTAEEIFDDVPQKVKAEHTRPSKIQAHIRDHLHQHLKRVGEGAMDFLVKNRIKQLDGVIIGSHKELFGQIEKFLPERLQKKVIGKFVADFHLSTGDITQKAKLALQ